MKILTGDELKQLVAAAGFNVNQCSIVDRQYALPTRQFLDGAFSWALRSFQAFFNILNWSEEANDCDDFARIAAGFAQILHFLTRDRPPKTALAVGELWYFQDSGGAHAINIAVCGPDANDVVCYEPQTRRVVMLSLSEKTLVMAIRF